MTYKNPSIKVDCFDDTALLFVVQSTKFHWPRWESNALTPEKIKAALDEAYTNSRM